MSRLCLYYKQSPERDRWIPGDRHVRPLIRRLIRGKPRPGGVDKVFINLCRGLDRLGRDYKVNLPFDQLRPDDTVGVLGRGRHALEGYARDNPIVAGIGLMTHPSEWPNLCEEYPVVRYLQHSQWANDVYEPYFGEERCTIWPVGIHTDKWRPQPEKPHSTDVLIYDKIMWNREQLVPGLRGAIQDTLRERGISYEIIEYGSYEPAEYKKALARCRAMVFLCEHESQGLAYQEALSCDVPILAWDQGQCLDPDRFVWGDPHIPATSVPYWDERCGMTFADAGAFAKQFGAFWERVEAGAFEPRAYILENLTLEKCAHRYVDIAKRASSDVTEQVS